MALADKLIFSIRLLLILGRREVFDYAGGDFVVFLKIFLKNFYHFDFVRSSITKMRKEKRNQKGVSSFLKVEPHEILSKACGNLLTEFLAKFYEANTLRSLETKYVRYDEGYPTKFKLEMRELMMEALHVRY